MLPAYDQIKAASRDRTPFSNGFEWEHWAERNCYQCLNDDTAAGCDIASVAIVEGRTPMEWTETRPGGLSDRYTCAYFRSQGDGPDPEPKPIPDPPGQLTLVLRAPYEQARMLTTYPQPVEVTR